MTSTAIVSQGATLKVNTATAGAKTLTAITQANPAVYTSSAHGLLNGDVVTLAAIVGMTQLNGLVGVVSDKTANTFTLQGVGVRDTTGYTAYSSGGTATPVTYTACANVHNMDATGQAFNEIDVTNLSSTGHEILPGTLDFGSMTADVDYDPSDAGHLALTAAQAAGSNKIFRITLADAHTLTFNGYVKKFGYGLGVDQAVRRPLEIRITGAITFA